MATQKGIQKVIVQINCVLTVELNDVLWNLAKRLKSQCTKDIHKLTFFYTFK